MTVDARTAWSRAPFSMFFATCAGIGHIPGGPGTYAAIAALPSIWWFSHNLNPWVHGGLVLLMSLLGWLWCDRAGKALEVEDSGKIVVDEWVGVWLALVPFGPLSIPDLIVGLLAFRVFDIRKPWPVGWADKNVKGGLGVMLDDVLAGLMAMIVVLLFRSFGPGF